MNNPIKNLTRKEWGLWLGSLVVVIVSNMLTGDIDLLTLAFALMTCMSLEENDTAYARFLTEKTGELSHVFDMGKYNECSPMLNIVCAQKDIEGTYRVVRQLLENVDSIYDFQKSKLYRHKKFRSVDSSYFEDIREKLVEGFRDDDEFGYMKGYEPWENLIYEQCQNNE